MEKFKNIETIKKTLVKNTWRDWLINYIPKPIQRQWNSIKKKIMGLFRGSTNKDVKKKKSMLKEKKKRITLNDPFKSIWNLLGEERNIPIKNYRKIWWYLNSLW